MENFKELIVEFVNFSILESNQKLNDVSLSLAELCFSLAYALDYSETVKLKVN